MLKLHNRINELTADHSEWAELQYVLTLIVAELRSTKTPVSLRRHYAGTVLRLERTYDRGSLHAADHIKIHFSDPIIIKELKTMANLILAD